MKWYKFARREHFFMAILPYCILLAIATAVCFHRVDYVWETHRTGFRRKSYSQVVLVDAMIVGLVSTMTLG